MHPAGRALIGFWAAIAILAAGGGLILTRLGPPKPAPAVARPGGAQASAATASTAMPTPATKQAPAAIAQGAFSAIAQGAFPAIAHGAIPVLAHGAIPPPDPALLEPSADFQDRRLPVVGPDGRAPAQFYASRAGQPAHGPQVAILLEGIGLSDELDRQAVETLPAAISLGVSPYADALQRPGPDPILDRARGLGHETWLCLPMDPAGSPVDSEGPQALSLAIDLALDRRALAWSLSRFEGYVGVTNALGGLRGDRFAGSDGFAMVADQLDRRGLLYLDAGVAPHEAPVIAPRFTRHADLTLDEPADDADIAARLDRLEQLAQSQGSALGVAGPLRPVTIDRLRTWSRGLAARGIALVPVSALPAPAPPATKPPAPTASALAPASAPALAPTPPLPSAPPSAPAPTATSRP